MIPIFIGYDTVETVAYSVLSYSIIERSTEPVSITPVGNQVLPPDLWWRKRGPYDSTQFSNARFIIPELMRFEGWALFMDCDMLCLDDIAELWNQRDDRYAVMVRQHEHIPNASTKFLAQVQTRYSRKNWSSLMLLNCDHPDTHTLVREYVNEAPGLDLHGFTWTDHIGKIVGPWNELVRLDGGKCPAKHASLVHFTDGGPWHGYLGQPYAEEWCNELDSMLTDCNPRAEGMYRRRFQAGQERLEVQVSYTRDDD